MWEETRNFDWKKFKDPNLRRQFSMMATLGVAILPDPLLKRVRQSKTLLQFNFIFSF